MSHVVLGAVLSKGESLWAHFFSVRLRFHLWLSTCTSREKMLKCCKSWLNSPNNNMWKTYNKYLDKSFTIVFVYHWDLCEAGWPSCECCYLSDVIIPPTGSMLRGADECVWSGGNCRLWRSQAPWVAGPLHEGIAATTSSNLHNDETVHVSTGELTGVNIVIGR